MQSLQMQLLHLLQEDCRLPLEKLAVMRVEMKIQVTVLQV
mgnify:CR=1 FL=1